MKKNFKILIVVILIVIAFTGCKNNSQEKDKIENKTITQTLVETFKEEIKKTPDIEEVAKKISENKIIEIQTETTKITEEDYISGFKEEIKGYKNGVTIHPIISSIPFIIYIFETDNAKDFAKELEDKADLRWNICTEADEVKTSIYNNYVFFIMSPKSFSEE